MERMMDSLMQLRDCCIGLDSSKITERKKACSKLSSLLNNSKILAGLNELSVPGQNRDHHSLTWTDVFQYTQNNFFKEVDRVESMDRDRTATTSSVQSNREQLRRTAIFLPRLILKKASSTGVLYIDGDEVSKFVFNILNKKNMYLLTNFATDALYMLHSHILKHSQYYRRVTSGRWEDLIRTLIYIYDNLRLVEAALILDSLERVVYCCYQCTPPAGPPTAPLLPLLPFLRQVAAGSRVPWRGSFEAMAEPWLKLKLTLIYTAGCEWRTALCRLTETCFPAVLPLWEHRISTRQELLLHYCTAALALHHPHHAGHSPPRCHLSIDNAAWEHHLQALYQRILDHLEHESSASRTLDALQRAGSGSSSKEGVGNIVLAGDQQELFVQLAARVCCQVFQNESDSAVLDDTQAGSSVQRTQTQGGRALAKRMRLEVVSVETLCALLREDGDRLTCTTLWYPILTCLLRHHQLFWTPLRCQLLLSTLASLLEGARRGPAQEVILSALCGLVAVERLVCSDSASQCSDSHRKLWARVWTATVRLVFGRQCTASGLRLLRHLLQAGLEGSTEHLCRLLCRSYADALIWQNESLLMVESLIVYKKLPKLFTVSAGVEEEVQLGAASALLRALLPTTACSLDGDRSRFCQVPHLMSKVLLMLCFTPDERLRLTVEPDLVPIIPLHRSLHTSTTSVSVSPLTDILHRLSDMERLFVVTALAAEYPRVTPLAVSCTTPPRGRREGATRVSVECPQNGMTVGDGLDSNGSGRQLTEAIILDEVVFPGEFGLHGDTRHSLDAKTLQLDERKTKEMTDRLVTFIELYLEELHLCTSPSDQLAQDCLALCTVVAEVLAQVPHKRICALLHTVLTRAATALLETLDGGNWPLLLPLLHSLTELYRLPMPGTAKHSPPAVAVLANIPVPLRDALHKLVLGRVTALTTDSGSRRSTCALPSSGRDGDYSRRANDSTFNAGRSSLAELTQRNENIGSDRDGDVTASGRTHTALNETFSDDDELTTLVSKDEHGPNRTGEGEEWHPGDPQQRIAPLSPHDTCVAAALEWFAAYYTFMLHHEDRTDPNHDGDRVPPPLIQTALIDQTHDGLQELLAKYLAMADLYKKYSVNNVNAAEIFVSLKDNSLISLCVCCCRSLLAVCTAAADEFVETGLQVLGLLLARAGHLEPLVAAVLAVTIDLLSWCGRSVSAFRACTLYTLQYVAGRGQDRALGEEVQALLAAANVRLTQLDPLHTWSTFAVEDDAYLRDIVSGFGSRFHRIRMETALNAHHLFVDVFPDSPALGEVALTQPADDADVELDGASADVGSDEGSEGRVLGWTPEGYAVRTLPAEVQLKRFQQLCTALVEALTVEDLSHSEDDASLSDEHSNRVSCLLASLGGVCVWGAGGPLVGPALYALLHASVRHHVHETLVAALLDKVSRTANCSTRDYIVSHLDLVLDSWFCDKLPLNRFPSSLLGGTDYSVILHTPSASHLVYKVLLLALDDLESLAVLARTTKEDLLKRYLPVLLARLAPALVQTLNVPDCPVDVLDRRSLTAVITAYKALVSIVGEDPIERAFKTELSSVILPLVQLSHRPSSLYSGEVVVDPPVPHYSPEVVFYTMKHLTVVLGVLQQRELLMEAAEQGLPLHQVVLAVQCQLNSANTALEARRALAVLEVFLKAVFSGLSKEDSPLEKVSLYLMPHVLEMLGRHLHRYSCMDQHFLQELTRLIRDLFSTLTSHPHLTQHLNQAVPDLCSRLSQLCCLYKYRGWKCAVELLERMLLSSHNEAVQCVLARLPLLFAHIKKGQDAVSCLRADYLKALREKHVRLLITRNRNPKDLCPEVKVFLALDEVDVWALQHLHSLLSNRFDEYEALAESGNRLPLAERLAELCRDKEQPVEVRELSAQCLGHMGPDSLKQESLACVEQKMPWMRYIDSSRSPDLSDAKGRVVLVAGALCDRLLASDVILCQASSSALCKIMESSSVLPQLLRYLKMYLMVNLQLLMPKNNKSADPNQTSGTVTPVNVSSCGWQHGESADAWLTRVVAAFLTSGCGCPELDAALPVCLLDSALCKTLLPFILHSVLLSAAGLHNGKTIRTQVSRVIMNILQLHSDHDFEDRVAVTSMVNCALDCVEMLWQRRPPRCSSNESPLVTAYDSNLWFELDHQIVAAAALWCGRHHLALVQLEERRPVTSTARELLVKVYSELQDSPGVLGCGASSELSSEQRALVSQHGGQHLLSLAISDGAGSSTGLVSALRHAGLHSAVAKVASSSMTPADGTQVVVNEAMWESAWRLGQWEELEKTTNVSLDGGDECEGFHKSVWMSLRNINCKGERDVTGITREARRNLLPYLHSWQNNNLGKLCLLSDLEIASAQDYDQLVQRWKMSPAIDEVGSLNRELVLAGRISVMQNLVKNTQDADRKAWLCAALTEVLLNRSAVGRALRVEGVCESSLHVATAHAPLVTSLIRVRLGIEKASVAMCANQLRQAQHQLHQLLLDLKRSATLPQSPLSEEPTVVYCRALMLQGEVLLKTRALPAQRVLEQNYLTSVELLQQCSQAGGTESDRLLDACYLQVADISDQLYREATDFLTSEEVAVRRNNIRLNFENANKILSLAQKTRDEKEREALRRTVVMHRKNAQLDEDSLKEREVERCEYLHLALLHSLRCLARTSVHDLPAYKAVALWFENAEDDAVNEIIRSEWPRLKSHKLVPLLYQLVARVAGGTSAFTNTLHTVIVDTCSSHPHHGLPILLMMAHAHYDDLLKEAGKTKGTNGKKKQERHQEEARVQAAQRLVSALKGSTSTVREHLYEMEQVCQAYLCLANWGDTLGKDKQTSAEIPRSQPLLKLNPCVQTAPLTVPLPVQPSGHYSPPTLHSWHHTVHLVGGVNVPKRLTTRLSDGQNVFELLKGRDDMRQDAVLEQVFCAVNKLLHSDAVARQQRLSVRTYMVAPLSQATGLVQWCDNSQALGDYLIGRGTRRNGGLHQRYRPEDVTAGECMEIVKGYEKQPLKKKVELFESLLSRFKPVLRYMFHEISRTPQMWYDRRQRYTRSLATSCAAGYILGLGDRHPHNILLDKTTAEVIQIDLGVAFDTAKILPTPETVPFRLTQNLVDGLGVSGVEGGLRSGLEATVTVMRQQRQLLSTVVGVLRHDPLQQWQLSPRQMALLQQIECNESVRSSCTSLSTSSSCNSSSSSNESTSSSFAEESSSSSLADRCLRRVDQKLSGVEDGAALTVSEQVTALLHQATDVTNLCRLFKGWQAYV